MTDSNKSETNGTDSKVRGRKVKATEDKDVATVVNCPVPLVEPEVKKPLTGPEVMTVLLAACAVQAVATERGRTLGKIRQGLAYQEFLDHWCGVMGNARANGLTLIEGEVLKHIGRTPNSATILGCYHLVRLYAPTLLERIMKDDPTIGAFAYDGIKNMMIFIGRENVTAECNVWIRKLEHGGKDVPQEAVAELLVKFITREIPTSQSLTLKINALLGKEPPQRTPAKDKAEQSAGELSKLPNGVAPTATPATSIAEASKEVVEDKDSVKIIINGGAGTFDVPAPTVDGPPNPTPGTGQGDTNGSEVKPDANPPENATPTQPQTDATPGPEVATPTLAAPPVAIQDAATRKEEDPDATKPVCRAADMVDAAKTSRDEGDTLREYGKLLVKEGNERGKSADDFIFCICKAAIGEMNKAQREHFARQINGLVIALDAKERRNTPIASPVEVGEG